MNERDFPVTFRAEIIKPLVEKLRRGESVSLVGVASIGKGNILRQLLRESIRDYYFQTDAARFVFVVVDCNFLRDYADATVYAEFLTGLEKNAAALGAGALQAQLAEWARDATSPAGAASAQLNLRNALTQIFDNGDARIVFLLDDCDALLANCSAALMRALRALRDAHKEQIMYVTFTRRELARLRAPSPDYEHFFELTPSHMLGIKPYREQDSDIMLDWLQSRQKTNVHQLTVEEKHQLYLLTGGHAGMLKQAYEQTQFGERARAADARAQLFARKTMRAECEKIWASLEPEELRALELLAQGQLPTKGLASLQAKGLVREETYGSPGIFSPLFADFVQMQKNSAARNTQVDAVTAEGFQLDKASRTLHLDGRTILLDELEVELVEFLWARRPEACQDGELLARLVMVESGAVSYKQLHHVLTQLEIKLNVGAEKYLVRDPDTRWRMKGAREN